MLTMDLGTKEYFNDDTSEFEYENIGVVRFEYTLKAMYEWEAKWKKPFLRGDRTYDELIDFYKMMALDPISDDAFSHEVVMKLSEYIADPNTATRFSTAGNGQNGGGTPRQKDYTAEEIYALMFMNQIPMEFENRNLNRLLAVLRIISNYNSPPQKMSQEDIYKQNRELNKQRREQYKSKG